MTDVRLFGQAFWGTKIAEAIDGQDTGFHARFVPPARYWGALAERRRQSREILVRVGYRVGSSTWRGRTFDAFWSSLCRTRPDAIKVHYWIGTDVHDTIRERMRLSGSCADDASDRGRRDAEEHAEAGAEVAVTGVSEIERQPREIAVAAFELFQGRSQPPRLRARAPNPVAAQ